MRSATHAGALQFSGRRRRWLLRVFGSFPSRPAPAHLHPGSSLPGAADYLIVPHKSKLWGPGGAESTASRAPNTIGETEVAFGSRLGETGSDGTGGSRGRSHRVVGCVCICVWPRVGCAALLEHRGRRKRGAVS
ncbi:Hypothetical predicted protein [Marmota monax]|uniref:Uncharacterized protein n=1 Tax=Marmota monax TaxID=9995 RepID=A0A5E4C1K3_MARMO|nr:hypothetical protein GHT09_016237 [Marmota monax]VTJ75685.1 Hypothetical predicted protein [Marmota monax]